MLFPFILLPEKPSSWCWWCLGETGQWVNLENTTVELSLALCVTLLSQGSGAGAGVIPS